MSKKVVNEKVDLVNEKSAVVVEVNGGFLVMSSVVSVGLGDVVFEWSVDLCSCGSRWSSQSVVSLSSVQALAFAAEVQYPCSRTLAAHIFVSHRVMSLSLSKSTVPCHHSAIGSSTSHVALLLNSLSLCDCLYYCCCLFASAFEPSVTVFLSASSAMSFAESFCYCWSLDTLLALDTLSVHATAYREIFLLLVSIFGSQPGLLLAVTSLLSPPCPPPPVSTSRIKALVTSFRPCSRSPWPFVQAFGTVACSSHLTLLSYVRLAFDSRFVRRCPSFSDICAQMSEKPTVPTET